MHPGWGAAAWLSLLLSACLPQVLPLELTPTPTPEFLGPTLDPTELLETHSLLPQVKQEGEQACGKLTLDPAEPLGAWMWDTSVTPTTNTRWMMAWKDASTGQAILYGMPDTMERLDDPAGDEGLEFPLPTPAWTLCELPGDNHLRVKQVRWGETEQDSLFVMGFTRIGDDGHTPEGWLVLLPSGSSACWPSEGMNRTLTEQVKQCGGTMLKVELATQTSTFWDLVPAGSWDKQPWLVITALTDSSKGVRALADVPHASLLDAPRRTAATESLDLLSLSVEKALTLSSETALSCVDVEGDDAGACLNLHADERNLTMTIHPHVGVLQDEQGMAGLFVTDPYADSTQGFILAAPGPLGSEKPLDQRDDVLLRLEVESDQNLTSAAEVAADPSSLDTFWLAVHWEDKKPELVRKLSWFKWTRDSTTNVTYVTYKVDELAQVSEDSSTSLLEVDSAFFTVQLPPLVTGEVGSPTEPSDAASTPETPAFPTAQLFLGVRTAYEPNESGPTIEQLTLYRLSAPADATEPYLIWKKSTSISSPSSEGSAYAERVQVLPLSLGCAPDGAEGISQVLLLKDGSQLMRLCAPERLLDVDLDGYVRLAQGLELGSGERLFPGDCADQNAAQSPEKAEICSSALDEDCDGEGTRGADQDGDGLDLCLDCDDTDPTRTFYQVGLAETLPVRTCAEAPGCSVLPRESRPAPQAPSRLALGPFIWALCIFLAHRRIFLKNTRLLRS
ncbi:MAG: hypothetical protein ACKO6N_05450 [Myxococcota bacterium]